jgi:hypothetical protein
MQENEKLSSVSPASCLSGKDQESDSNACTSKAGALMSHDLQTPLITSRRKAHARSHSSGVAGTREEFEVGKRSP